MKNLFKRRGFIALGIAVFLIGGFFVSGGVNAEIDSTISNIVLSAGDAGIQVSGDASSGFIVKINGDNNLHNLILAEGATSNSSLAGTDSTVYIPFTLNSTTATGLADYFENKGISSEKANDLATGVDAAFYLKVADSGDVETITLVDGFSHDNGVDRDLRIDGDYPLGIYNYSSTSVSNSIKIIVVAPILSSATITDGGSSIGDLSGATVETRTTGVDHILNISSVDVSNGPIINGDYPFKMITLVNSADLEAYFTAKSWPTEYLNQIKSEIAGASPFFYLRVDGNSYTLVDGFKKALLGVDASVSIDDDYPIGTYTFEGIIGMQTVTVTLNVEKPDTVYVNSSYTSENHNSYLFGGNAFATIQEGISAVRSGGTVNVASGTYNEKITIDKPVILQGVEVDKTTTIINGGAEAGVVVTVKTSGATVKNLTISQTGASNINTDAGFGLVGASNITIENNIITGNVTGVAIMSSSNNTIKNNIISNNARYGIVLEAYPYHPTVFSTGNTISGNTMTANARDGIYAGQDCNANIITGNTVSGATGTTEKSSLPEANGIYLWKSSNNKLLENTILGNTNYGIEMYGSSGNEITKNEITGNKEGLRIRNIDEATGYSIRNNKISGNKIYSNTLNLYASPNFDFDITENWWGTADENDAVQTIASWDKSGEIVPGTHVYLTYLPLCLDVDCNGTGNGVAPELTISGFTDTKGVVVKENDIYSIWTANGSDSSDNHEIQFSVGSQVSEALKSSPVELKLVATTEQTDKLVNYYNTEKNAPYLDYLNSAAAGDLPFAYIKFNENNSVQLLDGAQYYLGKVEKGMIVPDDFPLGTYTVEGEIEDLAGNKTNISLTLKIDGDREAPTLESDFNLTTKTINYTFNESVKLISQSTRTDASLSPENLKSILGIHEVVNGSDYSVDTTGTIESATLTDGKFLTVTYTGNLEKTYNAQYVIDAWGYDITDLAGNIISDSELANGLFTVAKIDPTATASYNTTPTNQNVVVTINPSEAINESSTYTYEANGTYTINFTDLAGNAGSVVFTINNIDKEAPTATVSYSTTDVTNQNVVVTINPSEAIQESSTYTYEANGTYTINFTDLVGNPGSVNVEIANIDKTPPTINIESYILTPTNQDILVTASTTDGVLQDESYRFSENGSFDFVATDLAGNVATSTVVISNIDKTLPIITIADYDTTTPAKTITVTASTNEGTLNATSHIFTANNSSFDFVATDAAGNIATSTVTITNIVDADQTVPSDDGEVTISSSTPEVVVSSPTQRLIITVSSETTNATVNFESLIEDGSGDIPQTTINSALATIEIPASTITSADTTWNGLLTAPKVTTVELPNTSGQTKSLSSAIELGFTGAKLSFDKAVKITMPGQAGKRAGYTSAGEAFVEITNVCALNDQATGDALAANSECKIDSGSDLVIWTKHFTTFATYTQTTNPSSGGGSYISYCSAVTYGDWGANINGFQYRDILTQSPSNCSLTVAQQLAKSRTYVAEVVEPIVIVPVETVVASTTPVKQVLGEKKYAEGTLLRGTNNRIYVVKGNSLQYVSNLKELAKYRGPILKVGDDVIASFSKTAVLGAKKYTDGTLIKAKGDTKIYVIKDGKKVHIKSLAELRTYKGKTLTVEASELTNY